MSEDPSAHLSSLLLDAEQRAGSVPTLRQRIVELEAALRTEQDATEAARREVEGGRDRLVQTTAELASVKAELFAIKGSRAWRVADGLRSTLRRGS